jgi:hypothetical protein
MSATATHDAVEPQSRLNIGVTGHRVLMDVEKIDSGIDVAIRRIEKVFPARRLALVSALAEGADRLVAHRFLQWAGGRLVVALPMPQADYMSDFPTPESRNEFLELLGRADEVIELLPAASRQAAYEGGGYFVLEHSDILITGWDGQSSQGRGDTGAIVAEARVRHKPIAWVHAGNRKPDTQEPTSLGDEQGIVTFENFVSS